MRVKLKSITPNPEVNIVEIARVSSKRKDKSKEPEKLLKYLINHKHYSPFEHTFLTFEIETSKAIGIQLLRHRSFTFQEFSQRYASVEGLEEKIDFRKESTTNRQSSTDDYTTIYADGDKPLYSISAEPAGHEFSLELIDYFEKGFDLYRRGLAKGIAKECMRFILPMATKTTIFMTGSLRSWLSFLNIRLDHHSQKEIVEVARAIGKLIASNCPITAAATNNFNKYEGMFM